MVIGGDGATRRRRGSVSSPAALIGALLALAGCASAVEPLPASPYPDGVHGDWAAEPERCADGWWRFSPGRIDTAGQTHCEIENVFTVLADTPIATYRLACRAEGLVDRPSWTILLTDPDTLVVDRHDGRGSLRFMRCSGPPQPQ